MSRREGEVVIVTGGSAGLGRAIAQAWAKRGGRVGLVARGADRLDDARREVERLGGQAIAIIGDVADPETHERAAEQTEAAFGPIDVWVNNASTTVFAPVEEMTAEEYRRVTEVTYLGYVYGTLAALRRMRPRDRGTIVQVGSALAYRAIPLQSAYCAGKHALNGFTDSLRSELIHDNSQVRLTAVHMPALNTPQFGWCKSKMPRKSQPVPPIFQPEVGSEAVYWAAHEDRRDLYVGWPSAKTIWGQRLLPALADKMAAQQAWEAQMFDGPEDPDRPNNLWEPVAGNQGAHGQFDARSSESSPELWATQHAGWLAAGAGAVGLALTALGRRLAR